MPADITSRLNQAFVDALTSPEVEACMATPIAERSLATQEQFGAFVDGELARHERVVKGSGAKED